MKIAINAEARGKKDRGVKQRELRNNMYWKGAQTRTHGAPPSSSEYKEDQEGRRVFQRHCEKRSTDSVVNATSLLSATLLLACALSVIVHSGDGGIWEREGGGRRGGVLPAAAFNDPSVKHSRMCTVAGRE
jgi:hypothetical protein